MRIFGMGLDWKGGRLFEPVEEARMGEALVTAMAPNAPRLTRLARTSSSGIVFRGDRKSVV